MRKILGLAMAVALFASCSDDDNAPAVDMSKLTSGKWYYSASGITIEGQSLDQDYVGDCPTKKDYTLFNANNTVSDVLYDTDCVEDTETYTYSVSGNSITTSYGDYTETVNVVELNSGRLVVEGSYDADDDGDVDGTFYSVYTSN